MADCGLTALPEGIGRLAGLKRRTLSGNRNLTALPEGLCALARLGELRLQGCGLRALPEGMEGLAGLRQLNLSYNEELTALPAGLGRLRGLKGLAVDFCPGLLLERAINVQRGLPALLAYLRGEAVWGVAELNLWRCGLTALPEGIGRLAGLKRLDVRHNKKLTALPAELGQLRSLVYLCIDGCPGLAVEHAIQHQRGLPALLWHLRENQR